MTKMEKIRVATCVIIYTGIISFYWVSTLLLALNNWYNE